MAVWRETHTFLRSVGKRGTPRVILVTRNIRLTERRFTPHCD